MFGRKGSGDEKEDDNAISEKMEADGFDGVTDDRSCTDVIFAALIIFAWGVMTFIGIYSWNNGDHRPVLYPMDYSGNICGTDYGGVNMTQYSKLIYINSWGGGVCVEECPQIADELVDPHTLVTYNGVYQGSEAFLDPDFIKIADYSNAENVITCDASQCDTDPANSYNSPGISEGLGFAYYAVDTFEFLSTRCISNPNAIEKMKTIVYTGTDALNIETWSSTKEWFGNLYGDVYDSIYYIGLFGCLGAMLVGFIYAQLLRLQFLLGIMIWGSILGSIAIIFGVAVYAYESAQQWRLVDPPVRSDFDIQGTEILSYCLFGVGAIIVFITIFLRKQIMLAMGCVREAARAIGSMPVIVLFPVIQTIGFFMFFAVWAVFAVYLASTGTIGELVLPTTAVVTVRTYQFDDFTTYCGWYLLFVLLWTIGFIQAMGQIVIAMCVAKWYFSREKWKVGSLAVFKCIKDSFKFHLGTAAFGSFIVAVVQIIRIIVAKAQKRAKEMGNKIGEALLCCCQCCLWCFEKFIKFLNKNAYIQTAIFGTPFCRSARESFLLIARNAGKVGSISYVSTIVLFVGKLFISCLTTGVAYIYMDSQIGEEVYSLGGPLLFIFVMSYFIGDMFLDIFDMSTNTILHCFVADEEMFADEDGGVDKCYAEGQLREWLDDHDKSERKIVGAR